MRQIESHCSVDKVSVSKCRPALVFCLQLLHLELSNLAGQHIVAGSCCECGLAWQNAG